MKKKIYVKRMRDIHTINIRSYIFYKIKKEEERKKKQNGNIRSR